MMARQLNKILESIDFLQRVGTTDSILRNISFDSRTVGHDDLFVAVKGVKMDGHDFIPEVINKGVAAVICERIPDNMPENIVFIKVRNSAVALGQAASAWYDHPSTKLKVIGITGTNGKTSTVFLLYHLFKGLGFKTGLLSTIENRIGDEKVASTHTTADSIQINKNLAKMIESGCHYCFMELSSHAIDQERIAGLKISGAIFSNISHDHLDYHVTLDNYIKAKKKLFDELPTDAFVLVNADDSHSKIMLQNCVARKFNYSLKSPSDYKGRILENSFDGLLLRIDNQEVWCRLVGSFNAYNLLATFAVARIEGFQNHEVLPLLSLLAPVEGRFQIIRSKAGITVIVDYAHTPDALKKCTKDNK